MSSSVLIGLPHGVRTFGAATVDEFVLVPQRGRAVVCQGDHRWIEAGHDGSNGAVGRHRPAVGYRDACPPTVSHRALLWQSSVTRSRAA
jgi:hypothetical protein